MKAKTRRNENFKTRIKPRSGDSERINRDPTEGGVETIEQALKNQQKRAHGERSKGYKKAA